MYVKENCLYLWLWTLWEVLPLLSFTGGYYLTSAYGALSLIKNFQEEQAAQLLSSEARDTLRQWHKRRTTNRTIPSVDDFQVELRAQIENGMIVLVEILIWEVWFIANSLGAISRVKQCWDYVWQICHNFEVFSLFIKQFHYNGLKKTLNNRAFLPSLLSHVKQGQTALYLKFSFFACFIV